MLLTVRTQICNCKGFKRQRFLGIGAFAAPLAATQFAQLHGWSFHFLVSLGIAIVNVIFLVLVFKLSTQNGEYVSSQAQRYRH